MNILTAEHLTKAYSERVLLSDVSFSLEEGEKVGVIGTNGMGKSTLLKLLAGTEEPDEGKIITAGFVKIAYLPQNPVMDENSTVLSAVLEGEKETDYGRESEAKSLLNHLDLSDFEARIGELSGGQKKRAALVKTLLEDADILILDEPTNHLDTEMADFLEEYLIRSKKALVLVTHDRYFLDRVAGRIVEVDRGKLYTYPGSYSKYVELKEERLDMARASERKRQSILRTELKWLARGARARTTKQKAHIARITDMQKISAPQEDAQMSMKSLSQRMGKKTVEISGISKTRNNKVLFTDFSYNFLKGDRIGIIGKNGCGKSTLLNIITGRLAPDTGYVDIGSTVKIAYFSQENEEMDDSRLAIDYIKDVAEYIDTPDGKMSASALMEQFLFDGTMQWTRIGKLSGGEKRRLYLLKLLAGAPNVLILDEPTNDLDIRTLNVLEDFLDSFDGIVLSVSHDRYFLDRTARRLFAFEDSGVIRQYEGSCSEYRAEKELLTLFYAEKGRMENKADRKNEQDNSGKKGKYDKPREKKLKFTFSEEKEFKTIDDDIAALEEKIAKLDKEAEEVSSDFVKLSAIMEEKNALSERLEEKMERWVYLNDLDEKIKAAAKER